LGNQTLAIIKPDAVENGYAGEIISMIIKAGFKIKAMKMTRLTESSAKGFYEIHKERPFLPVRASLWRWNERMQLKSIGN
jgi:nucleoside-diphosphate kinase